MPAGSGQGGPGSPGFIVPDTDLRHLHQVVLPRGPLSVLFSCWMGSSCRTTVRQQSFPQAAPPRALVPLVKDMLVFALVRSHLLVFSFLATPHGRNILFLAFWALLRWRVYLCRVVLGGCLAGCVACCRPEARDTASALPLGRDSEGLAASPEDAANVLLGGGQDTWAVVPQNQIITVTNSRLVPLTQGCLQVKGVGPAPCRQCPSLQ